MEAFEDITRVCADCGGHYVWLSADQKYAHTMGYHPPKRCPHCRQLAKERRQQEQSAR